MTLGHATDTFSILSKPSKVREQDRGTKTKEVKKEKWRRDWKI